MSKRIVEAIWSIIIVGAFSLCLIAGFFQFGIFTDNKRLGKYNRLLGERESVVKQELTSPIRVFNRGDTEGFPLPGFREPRLPEWTTCYVYQEKYGVIYIAIAQGRVVAVEYAGG